MKFKKIGLMIGALGLFTPAIATIACGETDQNPTIQFAKSDSALFNEPALGETTGIIKDITLSLFFDEANLTPSEKIENFAATISLLKSIVIDKQSAIVVKMAYKDATISAEVGIQYNGNDKPVITVNKVTIIKGVVTYEPSSEANAASDDQANVVKISAIKTYIKKVIVASANMTKEIVTNPSSTQVFSAFLTQIAGTNE